MGNMHLVTGYQGREHVTAADHGSLYAAIFGSGSYVLDRGNKFAASLIASNQVRIADGDLVIQGRHVRLSEGSTVDLTIESGTQGYKRNDLIVARYTRNASTGVEDVNLVVIKGTDAVSNPTAPEYNNGDILNDRAEISDFPLYGVPLDGVTVGTPVKLFEVAYLVTLGSDRKIPSEYLPSMNYIPTSQKGAASGVATLGTDGKVPTSQLPSMNYIPTSQKGAASGVAPLNSSRKIDSTYLPSMNYIPTSQKGTASGVATLGSDGKVPTTQLPSMDYIPTSHKGAASGVAPLNASKKIDSTYLPSMDYIPTSQKGAANGVAALNSSGKIPSVSMETTSEYITPTYVACALSSASNSGCRIEKWGAVGVFSFWGGLIPTGTTSGMEIRIPKSGGFGGVMEATISCWVSVSDSDGGYTPTKMNLRVYAHSGGMTLTLSQTNNEVFSTSKTYLLSYNTMFLDV